MSKKKNRKRNDEKSRSLEKKPAIEKEKASNQSISVKLEQSQVDEIMDQITDRIQWSTNSIIDKIPPSSAPSSNNLKKDTFSTLIRWILSIVFIGFGIGLIIMLISNWSTYWIGGVHNISVLCIIFIGLISAAIGIDIFKEKDRTYIISLFSAIVSLVALIVTLVKG